MELMLRSLQILRRIIPGTCMMRLCIQYSRASRMAENLGTAINVFCSQMDLGLPVRLTSCSQYPSMLSLVR